MTASIFVLTLRILSLANVIRDTCQASLVSIILHVDFEYVCSKKENTL